MSSKVFDNSQPDARSQTHTYTLTHHREDKWSIRTSLQVSDTKRFKCMIWRVGGWVSKRINYATIIALNSNANNYCISEPKVKLTPLIKWCNAMHALQWKAKVYDSPLVNDLWKLSDLLTNNIQFELQSRHSLKLTRSCYVELSFP